MESNGRQLFGGALGICVLFAAIIAAVVSPQNQLITSNSEDIRDLKAVLLSDEERTRQVVERLAAMMERFKEVETQFKGERELRTAREEGFVRRLELLESGGNPRHDERINSLEKQLTELKRLLRENGVK